jgi:hypothetical protein
MQNKKCFTCGATLDVHAGFCSSCGRQIKKPSPDHRGNQPSGTHNQSAMITESAKAYDLLYQAISVAEKKARVNYIKFLLLMLFLCLAVAVLLPSSRFIIFSPVLLFPLIIFVVQGMPGKGRWAVESEYYSLPHSKANGHHRCIFCGAKGIYRKGQYASNYVYSRCTKCSGNLYVS